VYYSPTEPAVRSLSFESFLMTLSQNIVYFCEVRWLSRGKMLRRFWELTDEVIKFLRSKNKDTEVALISNPAWQTDLTLLVAVTQHLNDLNLKLQGKNQLVCQLANHVSAFRAKLQLS
jgi:hypothetical protein